MLFSDRETDRDTERERETERQTETTVYHKILLLKEMFLTDLV